VVKKNKTKREEIDNIMLTLLRRVSVSKYIIYSMQLKQKKLFDVID